MIHHITFEVGASAVGPEMEFWRALGFSRDYQKGRATNYPVEWLRSRHSGDPRYIALKPITDPNWNVVLTESICFVPDDLPTIRRALQRLPLTIKAEVAEEYWGATRYYVWSPAGHRIELLERQPLAHRYGPPEDS